MSNTLQLQRRVRRIVPVVVIVVGLLLISAIMIQQVAAQSGGGLQPPFKLARTGSVASFDQHRPVALPLNAPIIMSQTFDSTYTPIANLNQPGWHESFASGATSQYTWGRVTTGPLTDTVWSVGRNPTGFQLLNPATGTYTKGMQALLIYGPLDLTDYTQLVMTGTYWLDTAPGDYLGVAYSTDGTNWNELYAHSTANPTLSQAHVFYASLNQVARQPVVWIALTFVSNEDNLVGRGAFVRDVVLRGNPSYKIFMPLIRRDPTPTPTLTPTPSTVYRYDYRFGAGASDDPDFLQWGGNKTTGCGTNCSYVQNIVTLGNPGGAMTLYLNKSNATGGASPSGAAGVATANNFEYSADFNVYNGQLDARYGLIFNASTSTFPGSPPFQPDRNYYKLEMHFSTADRTKVATYQLHQCSNGGCAAVTAETNLPISLSSGQWHNLKIRQQDTTITFYLNGSPLVNASYDLNWGNDRRKFGVYIQAKGTNSGDPLEVFFDNVRVMDLP